MTLTVHHLQVSQAERIVWLCEELGLSYNLVLHKRDPIFSPQSIKDLNPIGQAPVIQDGDITLAESAACAEYIIHTYGQGRLTIAPGQKNYAQYLYWFHFANGTLQPQLLTTLQMSRVTSAGAYASSLVDRRKKMLAFIDQRLQDNEWLAGDEFTAADIMTVFSLTTMRMFYQYDLSEHSGILTYLKRVSMRDGYRRARAKADPELELATDGNPPRNFVERLKEAGKL